MTDKRPSAPLSDLLERLKQRAPDDEVTVGDLVGQLGRSTFGMVLAVPALIAILPIVGALPGVSVAMAAIALILSVQLLLGRPTPWLPDFLARMRLPARKIDRGIEIATPWVRRIERLFRPRLRFLTEGAFARLVAVLAIALALAMTVGALVPGGIVPPAVALLLLALGLATRDGLLIALSLVALLAILAALAWLVAW